MLISTKTLTGTVVAFGLAMGCASNPPAAQPQPAPQKPSQAKLDEVRANAQRAFEDPSFGGSSQPTSSDEAARAAEAASEPTRPERAPAPAPSAPQPEAREDNSAVLLRAEGVGSSEATAQKAALAELSRLVVVEIESQFEASQSYSDGKTKSEVTDVNKVASKGYFSGIKYVTKNESSGRITVEAQLTQKSASETVSNLQQDLAVDFLNEKKRRLRKLAQKAIFLRALSVVLGSGFDSTQTFAEGRRAEIMQLLAQTRVSLELKPSAATMEIDGRSFASGESFFLRPGKHTWRVEASNAYETKRGDLLATKGERKNVSIELVPRAQSGWAAVMVRGPRKVLKAELGRYGYKVVKEANLKLRLKSNVEEVSVSGYTKYTIRARLEALRGESVAHVVKATTSFSTKTGTTKGKTEAQIEKLAIQLVERFLVEHAEDFFTR